jgi:hypothetical protein
MECGGDHNYVGAIPPFPLCICIDLSMSRGDLVFSKQYTLTYIDGKNFM